MVSRLFLLASNTAIIPVMIFYIAFSVASIKALRLL